MSSARAKIVLKLCVASMVILIGAALQVVESGAIPFASQARPVPPQWLGDIPGFGQLGERPFRGAAVDLRGCTLTTAIFKDDPTRVRPLVPAHYELGTNVYFGPAAATIIATVVACDDAKVDGWATAQTVLSVIGVQLAANRINRDGRFDPSDELFDTYNASTLNFGNAASWYVFSAQTNNRPLAGRLNAAGLAVESVPDLIYGTDYGGVGKNDSFTAASDDGPYRLETATMLNSHGYHDHDWTFWYDGAKGAVGFFIHLDAMIDTACGYSTDQVLRIGPVSCGAKLTVSAGSRLSKILGKSTRETGQAFNHPASHQPGYITILESSSDDGAGRTNPYVSAEMTKEPT